MIVETDNHVHVPEERAHLFRSEDGGSTEDEYLQLLYALVLCLKPERVLETGTFRGYGAAAMAKALRRNGRGHLTTLENTPKIVPWGVEMLKVNGLTPWATVVTTDSIDFLYSTGMTFDFALFDSYLPLRCKELTICLDRGLLLPGSMCALHDTSRLRTRCDGKRDPDSIEHWVQFEKLDRIKFVEFPFSRGLTLAQVL